MRYIGNKTKLLPFLRSILKRLSIPPGVAHDAFAGTAAVGRALKADGWRVISSDLMTYSYVMQRAYVVASSADGLPVPGALGERRSTGGRKGHPVDAELTPVERMAAFLTRDVAPRNGFFARHFAPHGGRMYFTERNARQIDAARTTVQEWREAGLVDDDAFYVLLAAIIEGADRVANTAGVYAAFIKQWQPNALRPFAVVPELPIATSARCVAVQGDAIAVAKTAGAIDLLYVDPPYNTRQYAGYYHVPELLARGWFDGPVRLRGKTGLLDDAAQRSAWCSRRAAPGALEELLRATGARHVLLSYNSEGVIPDAAIREILRGAAVDGRVRRFTKRYKRYRADSDHDGRRYKGDEVRELVYHARLRD